MKIDKNTHKIPKENHYKTKHNKTQIVIGLSLRKGDNHINRLKHKDYGRSKKWSTYTISRDGTIYQHFSSEHHSDFLGIKEADMKIVSIVLENMGGLFKKEDLGYVNWINEVCADNDVMRKKFLGIEYWEKFTEEQIESTKELCKHICNEYQIPNVIVNFHHHHKKIIKFNGIVFKSNYFEDTPEINPFFDTEKFNLSIGG